jgi:hypothetical protein
MYQHHYRHLFIENVFKLFPTSEAFKNKQVELRNLSQRNEKIDQANNFNNE